MDREKDWHIVFCNCEESKNFSVPIHLVLDDRREEFLYTLYHILSFLVKDLGDIDILRLAACGQVLPGWELLNLGGDLAKGPRVDLREKHLIFGAGGRKLVPRRCNAALYSVSLLVQKLDELSVCVELFLDLVLQNQDLLHVLGHLHFDCLDVRRLLSTLL